MAGSRRLAGRSGSPTVHVQVQPSPSRISRTIYYKDPLLVGVGLFLPVCLQAEWQRQIIRQQRRAAHALRQREWLQTASLAASKNMFPSPAKKTCSRAEDETNNCVATATRRGSGDVDEDGTGAARPRRRHGREPTGGHRGVRVLLPPGHQRTGSGAQVGVPASPVPCVRRSDSVFSESASGGLLGFPLRHRCRFKGTTNGSKVLQIKLHTVIDKENNGQGYMEPRSFSSIYTK